MFAGKHGFITLRDLFRWAERYRLEEQTEASRDWLQHLADDGMVKCNDYGLIVSFTLILAWNGLSVISFYLFSLS